MRCNILLNKTVRTVAFIQGPEFQNSHSLGKEALSKEDQFILAFVEQYRSIQDVRVRLNLIIGLIFRVGKTAN